jgi:hypothetical protein
MGGAKQVLKEEASMCVRVCVLYMWGCIYVEYVCVHVNCVVCICHVCICKCGVVNVPSCPCACAFVHMCKGCMCICVLAYVCPSLSSMQLHLTIQYE